MKGQLSPKSSVTHTQLVGQAGRGAGAASIVLGLEPFIRDETLILAASPNSNVVPKLQVQCEQHKQQHKRLVCRVASLHSELN